MKQRKKIKKLNRTGQLSIFVILIFQALFILFAMSLNITLVVHDKINLQNSVDIATYYGAMKQAEVLNAIAHINYQIRQSWKLMTWRYRVLGSVSITNEPSLGSNAQDLPKELILPRFRGHPQSMPYFFCTGHKDWGDPITKDGVTHRLHTTRDLLCKDMGFTIPSPPVRRLSGTLGKLSTALNAVQRIGHDIKGLLTKRCNIYGYNSWLLGAFAFTHFRADQDARKKMIYQLAKFLAEGKDLDGNLIRVGVKKTFERNLTYINSKAFAKDQNSLKQDHALDEGGEVPPTKWLKDYPLWHIGFYAKLEGDRNSGCSKQMGYLSDAPGQVSLKPASVKKLEELLKDQGMQWKDGCGRSHNICETSAGLYKNKNFVIFYKVKADLDYENQIFLPFGAGKVRLKAKAFARPFGGTIGPEEEDELLPGSERQARASFNHIDTKLTPNYSRFPGDTFGLREEAVHFYWANYIKRSPRGAKNIQYYDIKEYPDHARDPLAKNYIAPRSSVLARKWELMAISPDLFDVTYFTILPYYQKTYFKRIKQAFQSANSLSKEALRGDLGTYYLSGVSNPAVTTEKTDLLSQIGKGPHGVEHFNPQTSKSVWKEIFDEFPPPYPPYRKKPYYKIQKLEHLLTGFNPTKIKYRGEEMYANIGESNFRQCNKWVHSPGNNIDISNPPKGIIPTGCIFGGRMGYSVKLVSPDFLQGLDNLENSDMHFR